MYDKLYFVSNTLYYSVYLVKPRIDRTNLQSLVMKVGHTKLIDVDISGEPVPTVTWLFKDAVSIQYDC